MMALGKSAKSVKSAKVVVRHIVMVVVFVGRGLVTLSARREGGALNEIKG